MSCLFPSQKILLIPWYTINAVIIEKLSRLQRKSGGEKKLLNLEVIGHDITVKNKLSDGRKDQMREGANSRPGKRGASVGVNYGISNNVTLFVVVHLFLFGLFVFSRQGFSV